MKKLLPVGSVVLLKAAEKRLMVCGWMPQTEENGQFDYSGVFYPEGFIDSTQIFVFNHEDIIKIDYIGLMDAEFQMFTKRLSDELEKNPDNDASIEMGKESQAGENFS